MPDYKSFTRRGYGRILPQRVKEIICQADGKFQVAGVQADSLLDPDKVGALFLWVPKTAGSSIASWLRNSVGLLELHNPQRIAFAVSSQIVHSPAVTFGHQDLDSLVGHRVISRSTLERIWAFSVVRNPFTRAISIFGYLKKLRVIDRYVSLEGFLIQLRKSQPRLGLYNQCGLSLACRQVDWIRQRNWAGPMRVFHFENTLQLVHEVGGRVGATTPLGRQNVSQDLSSIERLSPHAIELIQDYYQADFEAFGYSSTPS